MTLDYRCVGFRQWRCIVQSSRASAAARSTEALAVRTDSEAIRVLALEALTAAALARCAAAALDHPIALSCARHAMALEAQALALARASS